MSACLRVVRKPGSVARSIAYRIHLDGVEVGRIFDDETREIAVEPGRHRLMLRAAWKRERSDEVTFDVEESASITYTCCPSYSPFTALLSLLYAGSEPGIYLSEAEDA